LLHRSVQGHLIIRRVQAGQGHDVVQGIRLVHMFGLRVAQFSSSKHGLNALQGCCYRKRFGLNWIGSRSCRTLWHDRHDCISYSFCSTIAAYFAISVIESWLIRPRTALAKAGPSSNPGARLARAVKNRASHKISRCV
jgi:hypothetical protein